MVLYGDNGCVLWQSYKTRECAVRQNAECVSNVTASGLRTVEITWFDNAERGPLVHLKSTWVQNLTRVHIMQQPLLLPRLSWF